MYVSESTFRGEYPIQDQKKACEVLEKAHVKEINNIFSESAYQNIKQWCKNLKSIESSKYSDILYLNPNSHNFAYAHIEFSNEHKMVYPEKYFSEGKPHTQEMTEFLQTMIERFAQEMKLVGNQELVVFMYRIKYTPENGMKPYQFVWHFDKEAKCTMASVFQNDFNYVEGDKAGLDIAENAVKGPHSPTSYMKYSPKDGYISCRYPENGSLLFYTEKGAIIHRRSPLAEPNLPYATRTFLQIKLKDPDWKEIMF